eukprot:snap_masked-scaffold_4-processed-gene-4.29-mRNA-1 protein AED:1.00 eAED:1.00 QI:0/0/0/0/1/1/2/0/92
MLELNFESDLVKIHLFTKKENIIFLKPFEAVNAGNTELKTKYPLSSADLFNYTTDLIKEFFDVNLYGSADGDIVNVTVTGMEGLGIIDDVLD